MRLVHKSDLSVNMNEALLRLQGSVSDSDSVEYRSSRTEEPFQVNTFMIYTNNALNVDNFKRN